MNAEDVAQILDQAVVEWVSLRCFNTLFIEPEKPCGWCKDKWATELADHAHRPDEGVHWFRPWCGQTGI